MNIGKILKIAAVVLIAAALIGVVTIFFLRKNRDKYILDGPGSINTMEGEVEAVSYYFGGGMEGESIYYKLTRLENGCSQFEYEFIAANGADPVAGTIELEYDAFGPVRQYCRDTHCLLYADMGKESELELLDAPTGKVIFYMYDERTIGFCSNYNYPEKFTGIIGDICLELKKFLPADVAEMVK